MSSTILWLAMLNFDIKHLIQFYMLLKNTELKANFVKLRAATGLISHPDSLKGYSGQKNKIFSTGRGGLYENYFFLKF